MRVWIGCGVALLLVAVLGLGAGGVALGSYNEIVRREIAVDAAWAEVTSVHQRHLDLVFRLVEIVERGARLERPAFEPLTEARTRASDLVLAPGVLDDPERIRQFQKVQDELSRALSRWLAGVEAPPGFEATPSFLEGRSQLAVTESRIRDARREFNEAVQAYNDTIRGFPASLVARFLQRTPKSGFEAEAASRAP